MTVEPGSRVRVARMTLIAAWLLAAVPAAYAADTYKVRLTPVPIDPATRADVTGSGAATAVLDGARLSVSGSFEGLRASATVARVHAGPVTGVRGPAVDEFTVPAGISGTFSFELVLTPQHLQDLREGRLYLQIHSESAPDGNLWGWLLR